MPLISRRAALSFAALPAAPDASGAFAVDAVVVWCDPERVRNHIERLVEEDASVRDAAVREGSLAALPQAPFCPYDELRERAAPLLKLNST
jgi:hypothetical protein